MSRWDLVGLVEQERRKRVRDAAGRRSVAGDRGAGGVELVLPADAAGVLDLQQEVLVVADLGPDLDRVVAGDLGQHADQVDRRLAAVPGHADREAHRRVGEAVFDGDAADAAREPVDVDARDAHLGRAVDAVGRGQRLVVVLHVAGAPLHDQARAERPRPGQAGAVGVLVAGAGEVRAGAAQLAERAGDVDLRPLEAEAQRELVAHRGVVVQLQVEGVGGLLALAARTARS